VDKEWSEVVHELHVRRKAEIENNFSPEKGTTDPNSRKRHLHQLALKG